MTLDELLLEWSYRSEKGYPSLDNPSDVLILENILNKLNLPTQDIISQLKEQVTVSTDDEVEDTSKDTDQEDILKKVGSYKKDDLLNLIKNMELDDKQVTKLYHRISNFGSYRPILKSLRASNYKELVVKRYSSEIQNLIEDLSPEENVKFLDYLSNPEKQLSFPTKSEGNLFKLAPSDKVPTSVMSKIIAHTTQDEGKKGVGMGELGMALIFKNVTDSRGKGDLALDGEEFEIKGDGATLGEKPAAFPVDLNKLSPFGLRKVGQKYEIGDGEDIEIVGNLNKFALALSLTYKQTKDKNGFKNALKETLTNDVQLGEAVDVLFNKINFDNPETIQQEIALMNLYRYVNKEQFKHFLAHDFGAKGANTGKYVYAGGSPENIVNGLRGSARFEKLSWNNCRPRIGFKSTYLEEDA